MNGEAVLAGVAATPAALGARRHGGGRAAWGERAARLFFLGCAAVSLGAMALITAFIFREAGGLFLDGPEGPAVSLRELFLSPYWYPTYDPAEFGALSLIVGSLSVTGLATLLAAPLGVGLAVYLSCLAGPKTREILKPTVELLAAIPSVVLGLVAMAAVAPWLQARFDLPSGLNLLNGGVFLALMATPAIASIGDDALSAVPRAMVDGSTALGATRWETISRVAVPAAASGLSTAVLLGLGRALGETMVVLMAAGGSAQAPTSLFDSIRPLTSTLAAEMAETPMGSRHYQALFAIGGLLFLMTLAFNLAAFWLGRRWQAKGGAQ